MAAHATDSAPLTPEHIRQAKTVLFSVFARYGDSAMAFKAINEFISLHPDKRYTVVTTHQALPYATLLIKHPIDVHGVNKRKDFLKMWRLVRMLRRDPPDIGFNPWSHGTESEFFISYCRRFFLFRKFAQYDRNYNLYKRPREYLLLPHPGIAHPRPLPATAARILLSPFSTDLRKGLDRNDLERVVAALRARFAGAKIIVAGLDNELARARGLGIEPFTLGKTRRASEEFIALLRSADVFVGVDTGPLHLADALHIPAIGLFGPTAPETVLDRDNGVTALRHPAMHGTFCDILDCSNPVCMHRLCADLKLDAPVRPDFEQIPNIERRRCVMPQDDK